MYVININTYLNKIFMDYYLQNNLQKGTVNNYGNYTRVIR